MKYETPQVVTLGRVEKLTFGQVWGLAGDGYDGWRRKPLPW